MWNLSKRVRLLSGRLISGVWSLILIGSLFWVTVALAGDVKVITDIRNWHHPVKTVLQKNKVEISKVELHDKTFAVFYVKKFPYDPMLGHNDNYFHALYLDTLEANGFWSYAFVDQEGGHRINITWDKKTKTMSENMEELAPEATKP
jgi:hypothetical protein